MYNKINNKLTFRNTCVINRRSTQSCNIGDEIFLPWEGITFSPFGSNQVLIICHLVLVLESNNRSFHGSPTLNLHGRLNN